LKGVHFRKLFILTAKHTAVHMKRTPYQADLAVSQTHNLTPKDLESTPKAVVSDHGFLFHSFVVPPLTSL